MSGLIPGLAALALAASGGGAQAHPPALAALADELHRHWGLECHASPPDLRVRVVFTLKDDGYLAAKPTAGKAETSRDPAVRSAARRAIQSVYNAAPFRDLPPELYGQPIAVRFNAAEACS